MSVFTSFAIDAILNTKFYPPIRCNCIAHFRPVGDNWKNGTFGFDWVRVGDSGSWCDKDGWKDNPEKKDHYANLMGKYYENGANNVCDDLNNWVKMKNATPCTFRNEIALYDRYLQDYFPIRYTANWKKKSLSHITATTSEEIAIKRAVEKSQYTYYVPLMMLKNGDTAELKILLDIDPAKTPPKRIEIKHNASGLPSPFTITNGVISSVSTGRNSNNNITIKCNATFSTFQTIDAYAVFENPATKKEEEILCGQLRVHPNNIIRNANILLIKVELNINGTKTTGRSLSGTELTKLRRVFSNQSFVDCPYDSANPAHNYSLMINKAIYGDTFTAVDTQTTKVPVSQVSPAVGGGSATPTGPVTNTTTTEHPTVIIKVETTVSTETVGSEIITTSTKTTTSTQRYKLINNTNTNHNWLSRDSASGDYIFKDKNGLNDLIIMAFNKDLKDKADAAPPGSALKDINRYDNHIKVFTFDNAHETAAGINVSSNHSILLFTQFTNETFAHEVAHALGLHHPFVASELDAAALFTYKAKETDNILDYSHQDGKDRFSVWYWQMQEMWKYIDRQNADVRVLPTEQSNETDLKTILGFRSTPRI